MTVPRCIYPIRVDRCNTTATAGFHVPGHELYHPFSLRDPEMSLHPLYQQLLDDLTEPGPSPFHNATEDGFRSAVRKALEHIEAAVRAEAAIDRDRLARALHDQCESLWRARAAKDPGWQGTMHGVDAHHDRADAIIAAYEAQR